MRKSAIAGAVKKSLDDKYPELKEIVDKVSATTTKMINDEVKKVKSKMPYKAQWVLEELIKDLEERV